ncbi:MAG: 3-methyladenine DNA glycosylase 2, partial [Planctomycetes bacterium]|nr:3-methyladenine DNA glycosylase 2 [Planctomycetota bacterium]
RALRDPDAFPSGDLVLRKALGATRSDLERRSERWRPWRAYATLHVWRAAGNSTSTSEHRERRKA